MLPITLLCLYLLPGALIVPSIGKRKSAVEFLGLSITFSIILNIGFGAIFGYLGVLDQKTPVIATLSALGIFLIRAKQGGKKYKDINIDNSEIIEMLAVLAIACLFFILVAWAHLDYTGVYQSPNTPTWFNEVESKRFNFPLHVDEWAHLTQMMYIIENKKWVTVVPSLEAQNHNLNLQQGFHIFGALHLGAIGKDPIFEYAYLAAIFSAINSICLYILAKKIGGLRVGILSLMFYSTLKSNINILGVWFFTPLSMSFFMIFIFIYLLLDDAKPSILILFASISLFTYPLVFFIQIWAYFLKNIKKVIKSPKNPIILGFIGLSSAAFASIYLTKYFDLLFFDIRDVWKIMSSIEYNLLYFYGIVYTSFAFVGIIQHRIKERSYALSAIASIAFTTILCHRIFGITFLIPYHRAVYYLGVGLAIPAAIGFAYTLDTLLKKVKVRNEQKAIIQSLIALGILGLMMQNYYDISKQENIINTDSREVTIFYPFEVYGYDVTKHIQENFGSGNVILTDTSTSLGIWPLSRNYIVGTHSGTFHFNPNIYSEFMELDCNGKYELITRWDVDLIILRRNIRCDKIKKIYENKVFKLYQVIE